MCTESLSAAAKTKSIEEQVLYIRTRIIACFIMVSARTLYLLSFVLDEGVEADSLFLACVVACVCAVCAACAG